MGSHGVHGGSLPWRSVVVYGGFWGWGVDEGSLEHLWGLGGFAWASLGVSDGLREPHGVWRGLCKPIIIYQTMPPYMLCQNTDSVMAHPGILPAYHIYVCKTGLNL